MKENYIIVILFLFLFYTYLKIYYKENMDSANPQTSTFFNRPLYTSGANMRFFGTTFTSTDQGKSNNIPMGGYNYT